jgi:hypothetical protein
VLARVRYFLSDVVFWLRSHWLVVLGLLVGMVAVADGAYLLLSDDSDDATTAPAPPVVVTEVASGEESPAAEETADLGFPAFATKNTTRVAGADPIANAAGAALAVYPSAGDVPGADAVTLVDAGDWRGGIAAASLIAAPVGAPILITEDGELPELTESAIRALAPAGSSATGGRQVFAVGDAATPAGFDVKAIEGSDPAAIADEIDQLRTTLVDEADHVVIVSSEDPALAMPAAAWAARSGDPVLFTDPDRLPEPTADALHRHEGDPVYVLADESTISKEVFEQIERIAPDAQRLGTDDPVSNAIEFARYVDGSFGWDINDPGHGFVIANAERPLDAAAAAPLSASGTWGPLLVTDDADAPPPDLRSYLLDLKPGYELNPTRAVYNHIWLIGDPTAISVDFQAQVDELAEVAPVTSGPGTSELGPPPGTPESDPQADQGQDQR